MKILIADDHAIVRRGMKQLLLEEYPFAKIGEADDAENLVKEIISDQWDIVICDMNMPGRSGLDALSQVKDIRPNLPVLIMSMYPEEQYGVRVIKAGAAGYLKKESIHEELIKAIDTVLRGKRYITPEIAESLAEAMLSPTADRSHTSLSDREFDVFKLLASGKSVSDIASQLSLSITTISTYRTRVLRKMGMKSNAELARYALENNLL
ncbi:MAG TPA: response regulator transcription factor [Chitinophagaceae bacterium]|nr:response regulator transcription factor [Chitinophagales bacterium]HPG10339.1 response regulator transcription factor [Chitinophagaceae bacterium]